MGIGAFFRERRLYFFTCLLPALVCCYSQANDGFCEDKKRTVLKIIPTPEHQLTLFDFRLQWSDLAPEGMNDHRITGVKTLKSGASGRAVYLLDVVPSNSATPIRQLVVMHFNGQHPDNFRFETTFKILEKIAADDCCVGTPKLHHFRESEGSQTGFAVLDFAAGGTLKSKLESGDEAVPLFKKAIDAALAIHGTRRSDFAEIEDSAQSADHRLADPFDHALYRHNEQLYFIEHFIEGHMGNAELAQSLRNDSQLQTLARELAELERFMVHRDFQSENIVFDESGRVQIIDHQSMREGRPEYDLASLLYDPYIEITSAQRNELLKYAFDQAKAKNLSFLEGRSFDDWKKLYYKLAAQRLMQALGAYGKLSRNGRPEYGEFIPIAQARLLEVLEEGDILPALKSSLEALSITRSIDE